MNGYDAVMGFLQRGCMVGDGFTLPDIGQRYTLVSIYRQDNGKGRYSDMNVFEAPCAICRAVFQTQRTTAVIASNVRFSRTCKEHRGRFRTKETGLWLSPKRREGRAPGVKRARQGGIAGRLAKAIDDLDVVGAVPAHAVIKQVAAQLPRGKSKVDERYRTVKRALALMTARGQAGGVVWYSRDGRVFTPKTRAVGPNEQDEAWGVVNEVLDAYPPSVNRVAFEELRAACVARGTQRPSAYGWVIKDMAARRERVGWCGDVLVVS
jgi:hypothetical protein